MRTLFASAARFLFASDTLWSAVSGTPPFGHLSTLAVLWSLPCEKGRAERLRIDESRALLMFFIVLKCVFFSVTPSTARVAWIRTCNLPRGSIIAARVISHLGP